MYRLRLDYALLIPVGPQGQMSQDICGFREVPED